MRFATYSSYFAGKLDFIPVLNVILLLLLFFLLCSSFFVLQVGEPIVLTAARDASAGSAPSRLILVVSHDPDTLHGDKIFFNDQLTTLEKLPQVLSEAKSAFPGDSLIAKIDKGVPTETLVSILQTSRELDLKVTLATSLSPRTIANPAETETPADGTPAAADTAR
jgi:biopolymer transport protein ExbD